MTTNLYWKDSTLVRFAARVVSFEMREHGQAVVLDQSAFYPSGGGQPHDTGRVNRAHVVNVESADNGLVLHYVEGDTELLPGSEVECEVDWTRRREMIQQHTGQHILSQAFFQLFGAETRGFRITEQATEIDLALELNDDQIEGAIRQAEELANQVVFDDREVRAYELTPQEAAQLPLRKESFVTNCVRVIEIADFDWSPCGGTHARRTGEVGLIVVRGWERAKRMTRLQFLAGVRALRDYRAANQAAEAIARTFSVGRDEAPTSVARAIVENKALQRRVRELANVAVHIEARDLLASADSINGQAVIAYIFDGREFEGLKRIAHRLVEHGNVIALLAGRDAAMAQLIFARSADALGDMSRLMKAACEQLGGRGGGKPEFAQGGGPQVDQLEEAINAAKAKIKAEIADSQK